MAGKSSRSANVSIQKIAFLQLCLGCLIEI
jgi:hypothetical protein